MDRIGLKFILTVKMPKDNVMTQDSIYTDWYYDITCEPTSLLAMIAHSTVQSSTHTLFALLTMITH